MAETRQDIQMTLEEYYDRLRKFDWMYFCSDDHRVWKAGEAGKAELEALADDNPRKLRLFEAFATESVKCWREQRAPKWPCCGDCIEQEREFGVKLDKAVEADAFPEK